jgi:hypothetical protein
LTAGYIHIGGYGVDFNKASRERDDRTYSNSARAWNYINTSNRNDCSYIDVIKEQINKIKSCKKNNLTV